MKIYQFISLFLILVMCSCTDNESSFNDEITDIELNSDSITILQQRDPSLPTHPHKVDIARLESSRMSTEFDGNSDAMLGYGYKVTDGTIGNANNTTYKVLLLNKIKDISDEYVESFPTRQFYPEYFSYVNFDSYEEKIRTTKKITSGFKIGIKQFSIGAKKTINETFSSHITSSKNVVYGELNMIYARNSFTLQTLAPSRKRFALQCISPVFLEGLYNTTMGDIISHYGEFVVTGYITGGKAHAYFAAVDESGFSSTIREKNMNDDIGISFSWNKSDSIGGNYSFGKTNLHADSSSYHYKNLEAKMTLYGGNPVNLNMSNAEKLENLNIDLSSWVSSLTNDNNLTMVDFTENGVYPISEFIFEENFKRRLDNTATGVLPSLQNMSTPYIEITRVFERYSSTGEALYDIAPVLITRNDDRIILRHFDAANQTDAQLKQNDNASVFEQKALEIKEQKKNYYKLEVRTNSSKRLTAAYGNPLCIDIPKIDEGNMQIFTNAATGVTYICDTVNKVAFSCMIDFDDSVLGDYGIADWVYGLSDASSININRIINSYRIIGL